MNEPLLDRLGRGEVIVLDGGTGSELHRRGVDLLRKRTAAESTKWFGEAWSASANIDAPDVVGQVHADYLRVGADMILTNTFYSAPSRLRLIGADADWERYLDTAVETALATRDRMKPEAYVAGAFSAPWLQGGDKATQGLSNTEFMGKDVFVNEVRMVGDRLVASGVDLIVFEYVCSSEDVSSVVEALNDVDVPVLIGIAGAEADGRIQRGGESIRHLEGPLAGGRVAGVMLMCTDVENLSPALRILREVYGGYIGAYPNNGYSTASKRSSPDPLDFFNSPDLPSMFGRATAEWLELGAQLVGGCCGTGPEHIRAIRYVVDTHRDRLAPTA